MDKHLIWPLASSNESVAASVADLRTVDQAVGVLVDRGPPPDAARRELRRRAGEADTTLASRQLALGVPLTFGLYLAGAVLPGRAFSSRTACRTAPMAGLRSNAQWGTAH